MPLAEKDRLKTALCIPDGGFHEFENAVWINESAANFPATHESNFKEDLFEHVLIFLHYLIV